MLHTYVRICISRVVCQWLVIVKSEEYLGVLSLLWWFCAASHNACYRYIRM